MSGAISDATYAAIRDQTENAVSPAPATAVGDETRAMTDAATMKEMFTPVIYAEIATSGETADRMLKATDGSLSRAVADAVTLTSYRTALAEMDARSVDDATRYAVYEATWEADDAALAALGAVTGDDA